MRQLLHTRVGRAPRLAGRTRGLEEVSSEGSGDSESGIVTGRAQNCSHSFPCFKVGLGSSWTVPMAASANLRYHLVPRHQTDEGCGNGLGHGSENRRQLPPSPHWPHTTPASSTPTQPGVPRPWQPLCLPSPPPPAFPPLHSPHTHTQGPALRSCKGDQLFPRTARRSPAMRPHHTRPHPPLFWR